MKDPEQTKRSAIPLCYQVETTLRREILSGEIMPGSRLPNEADLAQEYQVSRITVRQALSNLEKDRLVIRKRGKGTFVAEDALEFELPKFTGSLRDLGPMGIKTAVKIIGFSLTVVPKRITDALCLPPQTEIFRFEKVRLVKGKPFSHVVNYLPPEIGKRIQIHTLLVKPLMMILVQDLGIKSVEAIQRIEADIADKYISQLLDVQVGDPLLKIERTVFGRSRRPIQHTSALYRANTYHYTVRLKAKQLETISGGFRKDSAALKTNSMPSDKLRRHNRKSGGSI